MTKPKKDEAPEEPEAEEEGPAEGIPDLPTGPEPKEAPPPEPETVKPPKRVPKAVDVVYNGSSPIMHHSTDKDARDAQGNTIKYIFNPGSPIRVEVPHDIAKFCHLAMISNRSDWSVRKPGTDEELPYWDSIPYTPHPNEPVLEVA